MRERGLLDRYGISYEGIRARQVLLDDLIISTISSAWTAPTSATSEKVFGSKADGSAKVFKFMDRAGKTEHDVPDPYYTGNFDEVYALVEEGCKNLLAKIRQAHPERI